MKRRIFLQNTGLLAAGVMASKMSFAAAPDFPVVRVAASKRHFQSTAVEAAIKEFHANVKNKELAWLFENCFPNTLDTTVTHTTVNGRPDTYVITGDIDAMWLRDSTAQVSPYLSLVKDDKALQQLIAGVINHQVKCVIKDPYANAFYGDPSKVGEWATDKTDMKPGVHERKWEIDSLCYPIRLSHHYWKLTGDTSPFDSTWRDAISVIVKTFKEQQRKNGPGPYRFQRETMFATDTVPVSGLGYPVKPVGLICSVFRPSDDATIYNFLIPSNFFAVVSLRQAAEILTTVNKDNALAEECKALAAEVEKAIQKYGVVSHPDFGKVYAFEVNGFGSFNIMDDANVPSLLSLPYLGAVKENDPIYKNTRKLILSSENPFYFEGTAAKGIGSPHTGMHKIWPIALTMQGLTSKTDAEIKSCLELLQKSHAGTGFMHESFNMNDPKDFTRSWFAWSNTIFGEFLWKVYKERPHLLA